jgi:SanA protein
MRRLSLKRLLTTAQTLRRPLTTAALLVLLSPFLIRALVALWFAPMTYTLDTAPTRDVAIIFGAQVYGNGTLSPMLADRVRTGVELYKAGKVKKLLLTGDNQYVEYNEPEAMRRLALYMGVPDDAIVLDYAGRRTYDSCYRASAIFSVDSAILVTQNFHLDRALMLCNALGIDAAGVGADYQSPQGYGWSMISYSRAREFLALPLAVSDMLTRPEPVLGDPLPIFPQD